MEFDLLDSNTFKRILTKKQIQDRIATLQAELTKYNKLLNLVI